MEAPRIHAVTIEGHTSIAVATVELGSVNVLVGANGSGKSNFIRPWSSWAGSPTTTLLSTLNWPVVPRRWRTSTTLAVLP